MIIFTFQCLVHKYNHQPSISKNVYFILFYFILNLNNILGWDLKRNTHSSEIREVYHLSLMKWTRSKMFQKGSTNVFLKIRIIMQNEVKYPFGWDIWKFLMIFTKVISSSINSLFLISAILVVAKVILIISTSVNLHSFYFEGIPLKIK